MTEKRPLNDSELDEFFAAAEAEAPLPSGDLVARILADADEVIAETTVPLDVRPKAPPAGWIVSVIGAIGGWPSAVGLATAAVTGVAIGFTSVDTLDTISGGYLTSMIGYSVDDLMPSLSGMIEEG